MSIFTVNLYKQKRQARFLLSNFLPLLYPANITSSCTCLLLCSLFICARQTKRRCGVLLHPQQHNVFHSTLTIMTTTRTRSRITFSACKIIVVLHFQTLSPSILSGELNFCIKSKFLNSKLKIFSFAATDFKSRVMI